MMLLVFTLIVCDYIYVQLQERKTWLSANETSASPLMVGHFVCFSFTNSTTDGVPLEQALQYANCWSLDSYDRLLLNMSHSSDKKCMLTMITILSMWPSVQTMNYDLIGVMYKTHPRTYMECKLYND